MCFSATEVIYDNQPEAIRTKVSELAMTEAAVNSGLYSTITGYLKVKNVSVPDQRVIHLSVVGLDRPLPVRAVIQNRPAPLVVLLLGITGQADADFSKLWAKWYAEAGYNVLTFDSTFRAEFQDYSSFGVSGNIWAETAIVAKIIDAFLQSPEARGRVEKVGLVGMSYGAIEALILGQMSTQKKLPFAISAIQAYSPPASMEHTATRIDRWHKEDRWRYTLIELSRKFSKHEPVCDSCVVPFSASEMRAAIAAAFRVELAPIVLKNDNKYGLGVVPRGNEYDGEQRRKDYAAGWTYTKFAYDLAYPYWQSRPGFSNIQQLIRSTDLCELMQHQPSFSETIIAADDPLNAPEELEDVKECAAQLRLTIWPRGGHMGYIMDPQTHEKLLSLFTSRAR